MSISKNTTTLQIWPGDICFAEKQSCEGDSHWLNICAESRFNPVLQLLIKDATSAEIEAVVRAINAPMKRIRRAFNKAAESGQDKAA